ncbi:hypothetical protein [Niveibacterium sp. SC-1]|uniref:hypothetical protein n=1 Tax=Niveibacterium sp. SC-1 TaxID=3135646 RepID=UPI00311FA7E2
MGNPEAGRRAVIGEPLDRALGELQATAANFAAICIKDARVRAQYAHDIQAVSREFTNAVLSDRLSAKAAAEQVNALRNQIMDLARLQSSPLGRAYAAKLKQRGLSLGELAEKYASRLYQRPFSALSESQQAGVYAEIVAAGGRADPSVMALSRTLGVVGRRLFLVSLAVAVYEIHEAEDKPREVARQGVLAGAGLVGGLAGGLGAVATGACAATAPVCVTLATLVGGMLLAFGADVAFGTVYPQGWR